jgi:hypothetical protein
MLARARCRQDIANLYEMAKDLASVEKPTSDESRDYRYRMSLDKLDWVVLASRLAAAIDYSNFKSAVAKEPSQRNKNEACHDVWATLYRVQLNDRPEPKPAKRKARSRKAK